MNSSYWEDYLISTDDVLSILGPALTLTLICVYLLKCCICLCEYCRQRRGESSEKDSLIEGLGTIREETDDICSICLETFSIGDKIRTLPCEHYYHQNCISPWLAMSKKSCPDCRASVGRVVTV